MPRTRLLWQLYPSYVALAAVAMALSAWTATSIVRRQGENDLEAGLRLCVDLFAHELRGDWAGADRSITARRCDEFARRAAVDLAVVAAGGKLLCQSNGSASLERGPEIDRALAGTADSAIRYSAGARRRMMFLAVPIFDGGTTIGAIRAAAPTESVDAWVWQLQTRFALCAVCMAALAYAIGRFAARRTTNDVAELRSTADRIAQGALDQRFRAPDVDELAGLAESLNALTRNVAERVEAVARRNNEQRAVLASMLEGVLAVDTEHRIISINRAAARLLSANLEEIQGRNLQEVVRNVELRKFVGEALGSQAPVEGDIIFRSARDRVLQANGTALRNPQGDSIGAVIVLNDVTRLRQLENLRRDFAANVSHELKTPITSIKGFVETLLDGAGHSAHDVERFLRIIARQADRLNAIIEDLLSLAKIEREAETQDIALSVGSVRDVLVAAMHDCEPLAAQRQIHIRLGCSDDVQAPVNAPLLQQAVINLLDNAIKYSDAGSEVRVEGARAGREIHIRVADDGCGIGEEHLSRLFERFYRVDKARSRKLGGTGLGLAIVKHIVLAHRGTVEVESRLGHGSVFTIVLPVG